MGSTVSLSLQMQKSIQLIERAESSLTRRVDPITQVLRALNWIPVSQIIDFRAIPDLLLQYVLNHPDLSNRPGQVSQSQN